MTSTTTPSDVPRLPDPQRHPLRHPTRARLPPAARLRRRRVPGRRGVAARPHEHGAGRGERRRRGGCTAHREAGTLTDGVFETEYAAIEPLAELGLRQNGRAVPLEPDELRTACAEGLRQIEDARSRAAEARPPQDGPQHRRRNRASRAAAAPERFGVLQALLAHLLAACGDTKEAELDADELAPLPHPATSCRITSRCSTSSTSAAAATVYAELDGDRVHVDRSSTATSSARPAAGAARGAGDPARARHRADDRRPGAHAARPRAAEAGGDVRPVRGPPDRSRAPRRRGRARRDPVAGDRAAAVVAIDYLKEGEDDAERAPDRAVLARACAAELARPQLGPDIGRRALVPARPDALGAARGRALPARAARASTRTSSRTRGRFACVTRSRSRATGSSAARRALTDGSALGTLHVAGAATGSRARSSPTAARPWWSSPRTCAPRSRSASASSCASCDSRA